MEANAVRLTGVLVACAMAVSAAQAQPAQTAQGAQAFLRAFFDNRADGGRWLEVPGMVSLINGTPATLLIGITAMDTVDAQGNSAPCVTAVRGLDFGNIVLESNGVYYNRGDSAMPVFPGVYTTPQYLHWGHASIIRRVGTSPTLTSHTISATFRMNGDVGPNAAFRLSTADPDIADRIEYAMKFLKMSCDPTAATGF